MKLLLVGYFPQDASIYAYASSFIKPLQRLGFDVKTFNYRHNYLPNSNKICRAVNNYFMNHQLLTTTLKFRPDMVFCIKAETIMPTTLKAIKKNSNAHLINFYPDSPFALWNGNSTVNILKSLSIYDHLLSWSHELIPALISSGCKKVSYFPFAFDQDLFKQDLSISPEDRQQFLSDVCFIGTWEPEREQWLNHLCNQLPMINLAIWGNEWFNHIQPNTPLYHKIRGNAIYGVTMRKAFACSKVVLNFIRQQNIQAHNMRTFEVPASKTFLLTQRTVDQATSLFKEEESIACFTTPQEFIQKIIFYLAHDQERNKIIQNGFLRAQEFTLDKQLGMLLKVPIT